MREIAKEKTSNLEADYAHMRNMIFGPAPSFAEILAVVKELETRIHAIAPDQYHDCHK